MRFWGQIQLTPPTLMLLIFFPPSWRLFWLELAQAQALFHVPEGSACTRLLLYVYILVSEQHLCCAQPVGIKIGVFLPCSRDSRLPSIPSPLPFLPSLVLTPCNPGEVLGLHVLLQDMRLAL